MFKEQNSFVSKNVENFVMQTNAFQSSVTVHVWQAMASEYMKDMALALCNVISRHLQEAEQARQQGTIHW